MTAKTVVIGAGPGGLAAAMLLAKAGCDVTVVEKQPYVGGRTSTIEAKGYRFDRGPTFFLYPRILQEIFAEAGYDLFAEVEMKRLDPQYRLVFGGGGELNATPNLEGMEREICRLSPMDRGAMTSFLAENREKMEQFRSILETPFYSVFDFLRPDVLRAFPLVRPWRSLHAEVGRHFRDPRLQLAFTFQGKYLGMSPFQCPSLFSILSFLEYEHGVWHPLGGCGSVSQAMARIATELGAEIRLGETVEDVLFEGKRATGVRTSTDTIDADAVVVNADFAQAMVDMVPDRLRSRWTNARLSKKKYSCSTFMMYLGIEGELPELPHHTIYLSADYESNLRDIQQGRLSDDISIYVQNPGVTDSSLAPRGHSSLYILVPVPNQRSGIDWPREAAQMRRKVFSQLRKIGVANVESRIRYEHVITPGDWQADYRLYEGATFNLSHNLGQMLYWRPHNRFEDLDSVYLVGGGTHPGSGLPTIYSSARIACSSLCEDLGLPVTNGFAAASPRAGHSAVAPASVIADRL